MTSLGGADHGPFHFRPILVGALGLALIGHRQLTRLPNFMLKKGLSCIYAP